MEQSRKISMSISDVSFFFMYFCTVGYLHAANVKRLVCVDWKRNDFDYCYLIPVVFVYIVYKKRFDIVEKISHTSWFGLFPVSLGVLFLLFGELGGEYLISYLSLWLMFIGYFWLQWGGKKLKSVFFPFFFLLTMFPPPSYIYSRLTLQMQLLSSRIAEFFLHIFGFPAYREGNVIDIGNTKLQVVAACSGLRYLIPMLIVGLLIGYIMKTSRRWRRMVVVVVTIPLAIFMNGVRLFSTGFLAREFGGWIVDGIWHDILGWCIFVFSILLLFFLMHFLEDGDDGIPGKLRENHPKKIIFSYKSEGTFLESIKIKSLISIFLILSAGFFLHYAHNVQQHIPDIGNMKYFPQKIGAWEGIRSDIDPGTLESLDVTDYILMDYGDDSGERVNFYVAYYASQSKGESIHSPETCMRGGGWRFIESDVRTIFDGISVNRSILANQNRRLVSYFWFPCRGRNLTNGFELKIFNFWDSLTRGRSDGALVRVITDVSEGKVQDADARILGFLKNILPVLNSYLPNE